MSIKFIRTPLVTSPYHLIQEELRDKPWQLLVACITLNLASAKQARNIWPALFEKCPTPESASDAIEELERLFQPLGMNRKRALAVMKMSREYIVFKPHEDLSFDVKHLFGIGKYGADSWDIFVKRLCPTDHTYVKDGKLSLYVKWANEFCLQHANDVI